MLAGRKELFVPSEKSRKLWLRILIGVALALLQGFFSAWWMSHHRKGPLETVWHNATWAGYKNHG